MGKITKRELQTYNEIVERERIMLQKILSSNDDIYRVYYTDNKMAILFKSGKPITNEYLDKLNEVIDYISYNISIATVEEEFFKLKYNEDVLQLNLQL